MNTIIMLLMFLLVYVCLYSFVDRVCKCIENCTMAKNISAQADELLEKLKQKLGDISNAEEK